MINIFLDARAWAPADSCRRVLHWWHCLSTTPSHLPGNFNSRDTDPLMEFIFLIKSAMKIWLFRLTLGFRFRWTIYISVSLKRRVGSSNYNLHNSRPFFVIILIIGTAEQPFWVKLIICIYVTYFLFTVCCFLYKRNILVLFQILIGTVFHKITFFSFLQGEIWNILLRISTGSPIISKIDSFVYHVMLTIPVLCYLINHFIHILSTFFNVFFIYLFPVAFWSVPRICFTICYTLDPKDVTYTFYTYKLNWIYYVKLATQDPM